MNRVNAIPFDHTCAINLVNSVFIRESLHASLMHVPWVSLTLSTDRRHPFMSYESRQLVLCTRNLDRTVVGDIASSFDFGVTVTSGTYNVIWSLWPRLKPHPLTIPFDHICHALTQTTCMKCHSITCATNRVKLCSQYHWITCAMNLKLILLSTIRDTLAAMFNICCREMNNDSNRAPFRHAPSSCCTK